MSVLAKIEFTKKQTSLVMEKRWYLSSAWRTIEKQPSGPLQEDPNQPRINWENKDRRRAQTFCNKKEDRRRGKGMPLGQACATRLRREKDIWWAPLELPWPRYSLRSRAPPSTVHPSRCRFYPSKAGRKFHRQGRQQTGSWWSKRPPQTMGFRKFPPFGCCFGLLGDYWLTFD